jgi:hypothetical protein
MAKVGRRLNPVVSATTARRILGIADLDGAAKVLELCHILKVGGIHVQAHPAEMVNL